jgi:hypothetical protein
LCLVRFEGDARGSMCLDLTCISSVGYVWARGGRQKTEGGTNRRRFDRSELPLSSLPPGAVHPFHAPLRAPLVDLGARGGCALP